MQDSLYRIGAFSLHEQFPIQVKYLWPHQNLNMDVSHTLSHSAQTLFSSLAQNYHN